MNSFLRKYFPQTFTYRIIKFLQRELFVFLSTFGIIGKNLVKTLKYILTFQINVKNLFEQMKKFGVDSFPLTLSIVGLSSLIISTQIASEMVKQGAGSYVGMLVAIVTVRELGAIMSGFAIISMIGSSMSAEIATMKVTDQVNALKVLKVSPIRYLFVPRVLAGALIMPLVVIITSTFGICISAVACKYTADVSFLNFINSVWLGLKLKDINICLLKASVFGFVITLISSSIGYMTSGGAKEVGMATTRAVVWSFLGIAVFDYLFALIFYF